MDWIAQTAKQVRDLLDTQRWPEAWQPLIAHVPDWVLVAAGPVFVLFLSLLAGMSKQRAPKKVQALKAKRAPDAAQKAPASAASKSVKDEGRAFGRLTNDDGHRTVRVFISSTFIDMQRERDILVKDTFAALRAMLRTRGVELLEVDLRWGITQEQSERGDTLPTLLAEIDRCRPYFIGLLGDRYGWVPPGGALTPALKSAYPALAEAAGVSVTAMEIMYGVLTNPDTAARAFFFERDPNWDWKATLTVEERAAVADESPGDRDKLVTLKAAVRAKAGRIETYETPADIGLAVLKTLGADLDARFTEVEAPDAFEQTMRLHRAYARERRAQYIGGQPYIDQLDAWMSDADAKPILITGASGGGKSTLIANWVHAWREAHPKDIVFEHYLGASPDSAEPILVMRRLWDYLNRVTGEAVDLPSGDAKLMDLSAGLAQRLAQANAFVAHQGGQILLVLDGLDKLSAELNLRWLPQLPSIKLLASSLEGEAKIAALGSGWTALTVEPLRPEERRDFITDTLKMWGRNLLPAQIEEILMHPQSGNPLFLKTVLGELRVAATFARLEQTLDDYLTARDLPDLFALMLERLEEDCEPGLVEKALPLIWASRAGLEEAEILAIIGATPLAWASLRNGLGDGLRDQQGRLAFSHDYLNQAVASRYLANDDSKRDAHLTIAGQFEKHHVDARQAEELPFQLRAAGRFGDEKAWGRLEALLIDIDRFANLARRGDVELMSFWLPLKDLGREPEPLLCEKFMTRANNATTVSIADIDLSFSLMSFLRFNGIRGEPWERLCQWSVDSCAKSLGPTHRKTVIAMHNLAFAKYCRGDHHSARSLQEKVLEIDTRDFGSEAEETLAAKNNLAMMLKGMNETEAAGKLQQQVLEAHERWLGADHPDTLAARGNLAHTLYDLGEFQRALKLETQVMELAMRILGPDHHRTWVSMGNLAGTLFALGDFKAAEGLEQQVLDARLRVLGADHPATKLSMDNLAGILVSRYELEGDECLLDRADELRERAGLISTTLLM